MIDEHMMVWLGRLGAAILAGAIIGVEREIHGKAAGLRTNILITFGACLFMLVSELVGTTLSLTADPGRIAAQVVSGIGFIGAGAILISRHRVHGLTTAAVIWVSAGVGLVIGIGFPLFGIFISVLVVAVLLVMGGVEYYLRKWFPRVKQGRHIEEEMDEEE